jgi:hypothetical protein
MSRATEIYLRTDRKPVTPLWGTETQAHKTYLANQEYLKATRMLFRKWERENGFVSGAAELLLPAGWKP